MVSDAITEGMDAIIIVETEQDADEAVAEIRQTFAGLIRWQIETRDTREGKNRIAIFVPTNQTLNDLLQITSVLKTRFKILTGRIGDWKYEEFPTSSNG